MARASPANTKTYWRNATKLGDVYCRVLFRDSMCARDVCALENRFGKFLQFKVRKKVYIRRTLCGTFEKNDYSSFTEILKILEHMTDVIQNSI